MRLVANVEWKTKVVWHKHPFDETAPGGLGKRSEYFLVSQEEAEAAVERAKWISSGLGIVQEAVARELERVLKIVRDVRAANTPTDVAGTGVVADGDEGLEGICWACDEIERRIGEEK